MATDVYNYGLPFSNDGYLQAMPEPVTYPASAVNVGGFAVDSALGLAYIKDAGTVGSVITAQHPRVWGIACTQKGAIFTTESATGQFSESGGYCIRRDGALLIGGGTIVNRQNAWGRTATRAAAVGGASFALEFADLGAGVVNLVPTIGGVSGTFTRATAAWTKLSSGLWGAVATGVPRFTYLGANTAAGAAGGYFAEGARTTLVTPLASIRDMTDAAWTKGATMTAAKTGVGIDGVTNSCSRLTGGAVAATNTALQTLVAAASSRTYSVWLKRVVGSGVINITQDGGVGWTDVTSQINSATFTRVELNASQLNAAFGIQIVTSGDEILADFNQFEAGSFASSPIDVAAVTRNADVLSYPFITGMNLVGTMYAELGTEWTSAAGNFVAVGFVSGVTGCPLYNSNVADATKITINDGTTGSNKTGLTSTATANRKRISAWGTDMAITGDGAAPIIAAFDGNMGSTGFNIGSDTSGVNNWFGTFSRIAYFNYRMANAGLQGISA